MAAPATASKPKLLVFDLDYTLWPFWVDTHVDPPFKLEKNGKVFDVHGKRVNYYPEVPEVLEDLHSQGYKIGIASRIHKASGIGYEDIIFFDDEHRNIAEVGKMGVLSIFVGDGVSKEVIQDAFKQFAERKKHNATHH